LTNVPINTPINTPDYDTTDVRSLMKQSGISENQKGKFSVFAKYFDVNNDGKFDNNELAKMQQSVSLFLANQQAGMPGTQNIDEILYLLQNFDSDGNGNLNVQELMLMNQIGGAGGFGRMLNALKAQNLMPSNIIYSKGSTYSGGIGGQIARKAANRTPYKPQPSTKENLQNSEKEIQQLEAKIAQEKMNAQNKINEKEAELDDTVAKDTKINEELKEKKAKNSEAISKKSEEIAQNDKNIAEKKSSISSLNAQLSGLEAQKNAIPAGSDPQSQAANAAKKAEVEAKIAEVKSKIEAEEAKLKEFEAKKPALEQEKQTLETERTQIENEIIESNKELKDKIASIRNEIAEIKKASEANVAELEKELETLRQKRTKLSEKQGKIEAGSLEFDKDFGENMTASQKQDLEQFKQHYLENKDRYEAVAKKTGVPAKLIAALHWRESNGNFNTYMHNGDPLGRPTVNVPRGKNFSDWESSAVDALNEKNKCGLSADSTDTGAMLEYAERYNGLGYRNKGVASPYVWAGTTNYNGGKYVADGVYSSSHIDRQLGVALMLKSLNCV